MIPSLNIDHAVPSLTLKDELHVALDLMDEHKLSHLAVVENGVYLGYVSEDLLLASSLHTIGELVLAGETTFTHNQESLYTSVRKLSKHQLTSIAVLGNEDQYLGVITIQSVFKSLAEISAVRSIGGVFSTIIKQSDYSLTELTRILEGNGYKILSVDLLTVADDPMKLEVVFKLNSQDLSTAYAAFERHGYLINLKFGESVQDLDNQDRLDQLFNFMKIEQ